MKPEADRGRFNFSRLEKISRNKVWFEKFDKKIYQKKKLKGRSLLEVGEEVLILTACYKKKDSPGKFCKSSVDKKSYFHKKDKFLIRTRQKIDEKMFYWLKSSRAEKNKILVSNRRNFLPFRIILIDFYLDFSI